MSTFLTKFAEANKKGKSIQIQSLYINVGERRCSIEKGAIFVPSQKFNFESFIVNIIL